ncbi:hypothetical protein U3516DRAFT_790751 [Neocallimastix sp. 'constans']
MRNYISNNEDYKFKYYDLYKTIWTVLIKNSYLIKVITNNNYSISEERKLKIKINDVGEFNENKFLLWKQIIKNTIDSLTINHDEERIIEFIKDTITNNLVYSYDYDNISELLVILKENHRINLSDIIYIVIINLNNKDIVKEGCITIN